MFYTIQNESILISEKEQTLKKFYDNVLPLPDDYSDEKYIVKDGELVLNPDYPVIVLNEAKQNKISENDTKRDLTLNQGVLYKEVLFDSDTDQKVNLLAIVSTMLDEDIITWFGKDNKPLECSKEDLINIGALITQLHTFCWNKNAEIKEAVNDAKTVEEVESIVIDYTIKEVDPSP